MKILRHNRAHSMWFVVWRLVWKDVVYYVCFVQWKMKVLHFHHQALDVYGIHLSERKEHWNTLEMIMWEKLTGNRDKR